EQCPGQERANNTDHHCESARNQNHAYGPPGGQSQHRRERALCQKVSDDHTGERTPEQPGFGGVPALHPRPVHGQKHQDGRNHEEEHHRQTQRRPLREHGHFQERDAQEEYLKSDEVADDDQPDGTEPLPVGVFVGRVLPSDDVLTHRDPSSKEMASETAGDSGTQDRTTWSRNPPLPVARALRVPPAPETRSRSPASPLPMPFPPPRTRSLNISTTSTVEPEEGSFVSVKLIRHTSALLCRSTFVAPSRTTPATRVAVVCGNTRSFAPVTSTRVPLASSTPRTTSISSGRSASRSLRTAARTRCRDLRASPCTSVISAAAREASLDNSRSARSDLSASSDKLAPSRSCMSRANRNRSSDT